MSVPFRLKSMWLLSGLCALGVLSACGGSDEPVFKSLELNIAHVNDTHSNLEPFANQELTLDGVATQVSLGGVTRQTAWFKSIAGTKNLLKLHAGDTLTGTLYYTFFKGKADAELMNTVCFDAFVPGNHEFDDGDATLKSFLDELAKGTCKTPTVSSNIKPALGTALLPTAATGYLKPWLIKEVDGVKVGIIGITIKGKTENSSRPMATTVFEDEVTAAQRTIDELKAQGVRHIVALTHQGYQADLVMATRLTDVDVIIGGDSHSLLGDFRPVGISSASGAYPTVVTNKDGQTVCVGQAWEYGKAVGLMNVQFHDNGSVKSCGGSAQLVIGDSFNRKDAAGAWKPMADADRAALVSRLAASQPQVKVMASDAAAADQLKTYTDQVVAERAKTIGTAVDSLCLVRTPGESTNRSTGVAGCEAANTLARGSDVAQVVAEAFLSASRRAHFALQNAGGVRTAVPAGTLSMNTAFTLLPFSNVLVELDLSGTEVINALEDAAANHLDAGQSDGSHPYAAGLRWNLDMSKPKGQRFTQVQARNRTTGAWTALEPNASYVLVTNDFIAAGRDGYTALGMAYTANRYVNTYLLYTQSFVDYVLAKGNLARPDRADYSHQTVVTKSGVTLP